MRNSRPDLGGVHDLFADAHLYNHLRCSIMVQCLKVACNWIRVENTINLHAVFFLFGLEIWSGVDEQPSLIGSECQQA